MNKLTWAFDQKKNKTLLAMLWRTTNAFWIVQWKITDIRATVCGHGKRYSDRYTCWNTTPSPEVIYQSWSTTCKQTTSKNIINRDIIIIMSKAGTNIYNIHEHVCNNNWVHIMLFPAIPLLPNMRFRSPIL